MPIRRRRLARKPRRRVQRKRKSGGHSSMGDKARVIEVYEEPIVSLDSGNYITHQLFDFKRALAVSKFYKYYKCSRVDVEFIPFYNTFQASAGGISKPELFTQVDRSCVLPYPTLAIMEERGVLPKAWTHTIKKSYTPSVLRGENLLTNSQLVNGVLNAGYQTSTPVFKKWYMTQSNATTIGAGISPGPWPVAPNVDAVNLVYYGMSYFANLPVDGTATTLGKIVIKVHWDFKVPRSTKEPDIPSSGIPE